MKVRGPANASHAFKGGGEIGDQILRVFDAYRIADEVVLDPDLKALLRRKFIETHQRGLLDQTLDATQRGRDLRDAASIHDPGCRLEVTGNLEGNNAAKSAHLAPRNLMMRMRWQTGIVHSAYPRMGRQKLGERLRIGILPRDAKGKGLEATDKEVGDKRVNDGSGYGLQTPNPLHEFG